MTRMSFFFFVAALALPLATTVPLEALELEASIDPAKVEYKNGDLPYRST